MGRQSCLFGFLLEAAQIVMTQGVGGSHILLDDPYIVRQVAKVSGSYTVDLDLDVNVC